MIEVKATQTAKKTLISIGEAPRLHKKALRLALNEVGSELVNLIANYIFRPPKTGRIYMFNGRPHQASAPGESPANRTGRLARSGDYKVRSYQEMVVGETAYYAKWLEEGTYDGRIKARPHIIRAVNAMRRNTITAILTNIEDQIGKR